jgi:hypothetical protein
MAVNGHGDTEAATNKPSTVDVSRRLETLPGSTTAMTSKTKKPSRQQFVYGTCRA